ncbi:MAG: hypothetical protein KDE14_16360 [Rhodobacteraceae bacterium]|nr:hypothetical protein [Paracoccaceae bacterium]
MNLLRKARATKDLKLRAELIRDAQNELKYVDATAHPELVNAISAKLLALQGRGGDTEIAHVTPGEMVLHPDQLSARTRAMIQDDLAARGVDPRTRRVNDQSLLNAATGTQQFNSDVVTNWKTDPPNRFNIPDNYRPGPSPAGIPTYTFTYNRNGNLLSGNSSIGGSGTPSFSRGPASSGSFGGIIGSAHADDGIGEQSAVDSSSQEPIIPAIPFYDPCDHGMISESCEGWVPNFLKGKPFDYMPTEDDLRRLPDAQKKRLAEYYDGWAGMSSSLEMWGGPLGKIFNKGVGWITKRTGASGHATFSEIADAYRDSIGSEN